MRGGSLSCYPSPPPASGAVAGCFVSTCGNFEIMVGKLGWALLALACLHCGDSHHSHPTSGPTASTTASNTESGSSAGTEATSTGGTPSTGGTGGTGSGGRVSVGG